MVTIVEEELLKIFDESGVQIGEAPRSEVHKKGYWHETFHCWLISLEKNHPRIYFQIRSHRKKDYPNLLDITAAGHILATETVNDGIREVKEELGIAVNMDEVVSLGIIKNSIFLDKMIDREFSHVFILKSNQPFTEFNLQKEEVSGIVKADFNEFYQFAHGNIDSINVEGFKINENDEKTNIQMTVNKNHFVSHENEFLVNVVELIKKHLSSN